jgi:hypothetical protein
MSKELRILVAALVAVAALYFVVGALLPAEWQVESSLRLPAPPARVQPLLADFGSWQRWATLEGTVRSDTKVAVEGAPATAGHRLVWRAADREAMLRLLQVGEGLVEYEFLTRMLSAEELAPLGRGRLTVTADGDGCIVSWRDTGRAGAFHERWFAWFGAQQEAARKFQAASLARLKLQLEGK